MESTFRVSRERKDAADTAAVASAAAAAHAAACFGIAYLTEGGQA